MKTLPILLALSLSLSPALFADDQKPAAAAPVAAAATAAKNVTPDEAEKLLKDKKDVVVLDVRTPEEYSAGHIGGAKNINFMASDFEKQVAQLDPSKSYLVHCAAGGRSSKAVKIMAQHNFDSVYHMNDGFKAWVEAGKPVEK
ncbi:MAG TPA: rhodanese-like domain-containing protein [Chthoniobacteraceae bacterium]|jgi:rhodanese-related sulfurtransferase